MLEIINNKSISNNKGLVHPLKLIFPYENDFYRLLQDHRRALYSYFFSSKIKLVKNVKLYQQIYSKISVYTLYTLISQLCKFHKDQTRSFAVLAV